MKKLVRLVIIVLALAGLASGGYWFYTSRVASADSATDDGTYTQVVEVVEGSLSSSLSVVGSLEAVQSADLAFTEMNGTARLLSLEVKTGQEVAAGQVLASIDAAPYQQALDEANTELQAAEEGLADLQEPVTALAIAQAEVAVAAAEQTLEQAKADLADLQDPDLTSLEEAVQNAQDKLDLLDLESELAERDSLAQTERDLTYTVAWYQLHIAQMEELVATGKANLEQRESITSDQEHLAEAQANLARVQAERELARQARAAQRAQAQVALSEAQEALAEAKAGGDELDLAQAELAVHKAEVNLEAAQEDRAALEEGADATDVAAAQSAVDRQRLAVDDAEAALAGTELTAPFDGTILDVYVREGDPVGASTSIVTLANLESFQVVVSVDETTIRQVSAGQEAVITFDSYPDQTFTGQVLSVPLYGTLQGGVTIYDVPVSLEGAEALNLLVGMTANVEIQVGEATDALLVPTMALTRASGGYQVLVPNTVDPEGEPEAVPVQVGLSDGTYTQILKGLILGDQVLVELDVSDSEAGFQRDGGLFSGIFGFMRRR
jgi:macrolide-specific efflux system membrane fusion protein